MTTSDPPPYYSSHIFFCTNVRPANHERGSCGRKGSAELRDKMKKLAKEMGLEGVRVNAAGCLDRCELGPTVVIYPEGVWYRCETEGDIREILKAHVAGGGRVNRLMLDVFDATKEAQ
jgi:(2Fe-2S) ferredoxin